MRGVLCEDWPVTNSKIWARLLLGMCGLCLSVQCMHSSRVFL